jgi:Tfp pilus assembly protein FimV
MTATFHPSQDFRRSRHETAMTYEFSTIVPNYAVRRIAAVLVALAVLAAGAVGVGEVVGALADLGGRPAAASEVAPMSGPATAAATPRVHVAAPGDTMWSIAQQYRGDVGRDRYVDALIDLNGAARIEVGQAVHLP